VKKWIVTLGGAGLVGAMPGTMGSLVAAGFLWGTFAAIPSGHAVFWPTLLIAFLLLFSGLCVGLGPFAIAYFARKDPGPMVLDEAAGICLTLFLQPIAPGLASFKTFAVAFAAFRFFDIIKPPPARQLECLPQGWGILLDDLAAAVYANLLCQLILRFWFLKDFTHA
jgi:phosphatidylglycerophosphatase A